MALTVALVLLSFLDGVPACVADPPDPPPVEFWVLDPQRLSRAEQDGLKVLEDVRGVFEADALKRYPTSFAHGIAVHQPPGKSMHLRDYTVARHAYAFATEDPTRRTDTLRSLGPMPLVFGWDQDERRLVTEVSAAGAVVIPADWALNLSALQHLPAAIASSPRSTVCSTRTVLLYALVNVHAWSFRDSGGPMGAVERTIEKLPPGTRVVTASQLVGMLRTQFGKK